MDLPIELRLMIATHALRSDNPLWFKVDSTPSGRKGIFRGLEQCTGLVRACKQLHAELSSLVWTVPTFGFVGPTWPAFSFFSSARNGDRTQLFFETFEFFTRKAMPQKLGNFQIHTNVIEHKSSPWGLKGFAEAVAQLPKVVLDANLEFEDPSWIRFVVGE
jgi:hypothetical protein